MGKRPAKSAKVNFQAVELKALMDARQHFLPDRPKHLDQAFGDEAAQFQRLGARVWMSATQGGGPDARIDANHRDRVVDWSPLQSSQSME
jgi:hypothetical protein